MNITLKIKPIVLLIILAFISSIIQINYSISSAPNLTISGYVFRFEDSNPLPNAIILVYHEYYSQIDFLGKVKTNENGFYQFNTKRLYSYSGSLKIYVFHFDSLNEIPDRVPAYVSVPISPFSLIKNLNFSLIPAAILIFSGGFIHVNYSEPASRVLYQVEAKSLPVDLNCLLKYDFKELSRVYSDVGLNNNIVFIPAGYEVNVIVTGVFQETMTIPSVIAFGRVTTITSTIREIYLNIKLFDDFKVLNSNETLHFTVYDVSLRDSFRVVNSMYNIVLNKLNIARMDGFYTTSLFSQLDRVKRLINEAYDYLNQGNPSASYATLRSCCVLLQNLSYIIDRMYIDASFSIKFLLIFFIFSSIAIGYLVSESFAFKSTISVISCTILLYLLSISYPLFPKFDISITPFIFSPLILIIALELLGILSRKFASLKFFANSIELFSISKRNLRRRKIRTVLTLISLIVFTAGSIALTSFSFEIDLLTYTRSNDYGIIGLGLEIRVPESYSVSGFSPVDAENNPYAQSIPKSVLDVIDLLGQVEYKTFRAESKARVTPYARLGEDLTIMGIVSFSSPIDPIAKLVSFTFVEGGLPSKRGEVAISMYLASRLGLKIGDTIRTPNGRFTICGLFDDGKIDGLRELSGRHVLPYKMILSLKGEDGVPNIYESRICEPKEVLFIHWSDIELFDLRVTRVYVSYRPNEDIYSIGKTIALRGGNVLVTVLIADRCINMFLAEYFASSGFEVLLPVILIVLNAVICAMASLREREYESIIMTSIGASPSQLYRIFINEFMIMGFSAGSIGYATGIIMYKIMSAISNIAVFPKISFIWIFFSLTLSLIALITGSSAVFRSALVVVPSKLWSIKRNVQFTPEGKVDIYEVPLKLNSNYINDFLNYIENRLRNYPISMEENIRVVARRIDKISGRDIHKLIFTYDTGSGSASKNSSRNTLEIYVDENGECKISLKVVSTGYSPEKHSMKIAKLIRYMAMEWFSSK